MECVSQSGGKAVFGWAVRSWPKAFLEAEQHVVWQSSDGQILDLTPHMSDSQTLFLADRKVEFDASGFSTEPNRYRNTCVSSKRKFVSKMIVAATLKQQFELRHKSVEDGKVVLGGDPKEYEKLHLDCMAAAQNVQRLFK